MVRSPWHGLIVHRSQPTRSRRRPPLCQPSLERLEARDLFSTGPLSINQVQASYGQIPLSFEANQGQADPQVKFLAHGQGYGLFLTPTDTVLALSRPAQPDVSSTAPSVDRVDSVLHLRLLGANLLPPVTGGNQLAGVSNYFLGSDPSQWHTNVPTYGQVTYHDVYPSIDLL